MERKKLSLNWIILLGSIPIFLLGSLNHFLYDLLGKNIIVGLFVAVNESIWEHMKLVILPMVLWWTISYFIVRNRVTVDINKWFTSGLVAMIVALIIIPFLFYFYTNAFGVKSVPIDISIFFVAVFLGQLIAIHFYKYSIAINWFIVFCVFLIIILIFMIFTIYPPKIPIFKDSVTGMYGIYK